MEDRNDLTIDLRRVASIMLKRWWLILVISLLFAAILFVHTAYFVTDTYTATTQMYVRNVIGDPNYELNGITSGDWVAATGLADTYCVILENDYSLQAIREILLREFGLNYSTDALRSMIAAMPIEETPVVQISVVSYDKQHAAAIANAATRVLSEYELPGTSAVVLYQANPPAAANSKGVVTKALLGFVIGFILCAVVLIVLDLKQDVIHSDDWLRETFGEKIPLLAIIPSANSSSSSGYGKRKRYNYYERYGYYSANRTDKNA